MPQYAVLIYERVPPDQLPQEVMDGHLAMGERVARSGGRILAGMALQEPATATAIRGDLLTDGPFIETKEVLGGYSVIEADTIDEAVEIGKTWPGVDRGWITLEVRPVIEMG